MDLNDASKLNAVLGLYRIVRDLSQTLDCLKEVIVTTYKHSKILHEKKILQNNLKNQLGYIFLISIISSVFNMLLSILIFN